MGTVSVVKEVFILLIITTVVYSCGNDTNNLVRLSGLSSPVAGRLEVCVNDTWNVVIAPGELTVQDSIVVCRSLGYQSSAQLHYERFLLPAQTTQSSTLWLTGQLQCTGSEEQLSHCTGFDQLLSVDCDTAADSSSIITLCKDPTPGEVRLIGSAVDSSEGIVEVYSNYYGWSTIGTDNWDDDDAKVVCRSLGYDYGEKSTKKYPFLGLSLKRYNNFICSGNEENIFDCLYTGPYPQGCYTAFPARLSCSMKNDADSIWLIITFIIHLILICTIVITIYVFIRIAYCCYSKKKTMQSSQTINSTKNKSAAGQWTYKPVSPSPSIV